ncbi:hypothetical protein FOL47_006522 [Perkinsus chesapeaki]|uniref:Uncharacterized protein n=1 Tax=Perkinsus chesapeaki TaxID=330153 RepID=A0A7J6LRS9_PERCH|nr:hypothetical protein FOL47_006522 [Perkinsus chesapeaki]
MSSIGLSTSDRRVDCLMDEQRRFIKDVTAWIDSLRGRLTSLERARPSSDEAHLDSLRQRVAEMENETLALRRSSRDYVTVNSLEKRLNEVEKRRPERTLFPKHVCRCRDAVPSSGGYLSVEDPIYRSLCSRLEDLEMSSLRRTDRHFIEDCAKSVIGQTETERSALVKRIERLDKAMKILQADSVKMDRCDVLESRIGKLEMGRVHEKDEQFQLADRHNLNFRFDALREGLSSHILRVIEVLKNDIYKQVDGSIQSYVANLEQSLSDALLSERRLFNENIDARVEEMVKNLSERLKEDTRLLREECLKGVDEMLSASIAGKVGSPRSVIVETQESKHADKIVDEPKMPITEPEESNNEELQFAQTPLIMKSEVAVVEDENSSQSESISDDEASVHDPDALLAELGNDWDNESDT